MPSTPPGSPASVSRRAKWIVSPGGVSRYSSGSIVGFPAGTSTPRRMTPARARPGRSAAEAIPGHAGQATDELVGSGETGRAVGQSLRHVLRVGGQDEQRSVLLEHDAGVHEAAR